MKDVGVHQAGSIMGNVVYIVSVYPEVNSPKLGTRLQDILTSAASIFDPSAFNLPLEGPPLS